MVVVPYLRFLESETFLPTNRYSSSSISCIHNMSQPAAAQGGAAAQGEGQGGGGGGVTGIVKSLVMFMAVQTGKLLALTKRRCPDPSDEIRHELCELNARCTPCSLTLARTRPKAHSHRSQYAGSCIWRRSSRPGCPRSQARCAKLDAKGRTSLGVGHANVHVTLHVDFT